MVGRMVVYHRVNNLIDGHRFAFGRPGRERRVTEIATQIATAGANENTFSARERPFALPRLVDFGNQHVGLSGRVR